MDSLEHQISYLFFLVGSVLLIIFRFLAVSLFCLYLLCVMCPILSLSIEFAHGFKYWSTCCSFRPIMCLYVLNSWIHPRFLVGVRVAHLFSFLCCFFLFCLSSSSVVCTCTQCCHIFWIVHSWLPLRLSLTFS